METKTTEKFDTKVDLVIVNSPPNIDDTTISAMKNKMIEYRNLEKKEKEMTQQLEKLIEDRKNLDLNETDNKTIVDTFNRAFQCLKEGDRAYVKKDTNDDFGIIWESKTITSLDTNNKKWLVVFDNKEEMNGNNLAFETERDYSSQNFIPIVKNVETTQTMIRYYGKRKLLMVFI
jgi:hypothetical protein